MKTSTIPIEQLMTEQPLTIGRSETLLVAATMMKAHGIRHLPVLEHGELVGMLSERDLRFLEGAGAVDFSAGGIDRAMTTDTYAVGPAESLARVAAEMAARKLGSAVVVERGHVIGIFTAVDALRFLANCG